MKIKTVLKKEVKTIMNAQTIKKYLPIAIIAVGVFSVGATVYLAQKYSNKIMPETELINFPNGVVQVTRF